MKLMAALLMMLAAAAIAESAPDAAIHYTLRFPEPATHYVSVEASLPAGGHASLDLLLPVWTPGSYLVREFARNVEGVTAQDAAGRPLRITKTAKNRWRVETGRAERVRVSYRVYCREMSVRTNWVENGFALLNGAATFVTVADRIPRPHSVLLELPPSWKRSVSGLDETAPNQYTARDYDELVDSPILAGNPAVYEFQVDGVPHFLVNQGEDGLWNGHQSAVDVEKIVRAQRDFWGSLPYRKYVFLNLITEAGGGLEHSSSMCVMTNRWATRTRRGYAAWLGLISHEFFHAWNIKRLRPAELGPFDYERENPTSSLWVGEGVTDYYAHLLLLRAQLTSRSEYLGENAEPGSLSAMINTLQTTPGRLVVSAEQASRDAWIKAYRPDENTGNTSISYYTKGAVVAWLLDARVRHATGGVRSLDDVMRLAYARYSGEHGFTPEQFRAIAEEIAGVSLQDFFRQTVESTAELDYTEALDWFGLRFRVFGGTGRAWTGAETKVDNGRLVVTRIPRETPAFRAGLDVDDEILAIGDFRVRADQWAQRLENYRPGDQISILAARREKLVRLDLTLAEEPARKWQLEPRPDSSRAQKEHLEQWL